MFLVFILSQSSFGMCQYLMMMRVLQTMDVPWD